MGISYRRVYTLGFFLTAFHIVFFSGVCFSQIFPSGFSQVMIANGISNPTVMAFAPDGRIFVAQQNGVLRVIKNGSLLAKPFVSLTVHSSGERGLLGIAFDPAFTTNKYIYLYYTVSSGAHNRISRFIANGDTVLAGSEKVILILDPLSTATNHNGGNMQFGPDGKLYIGVGENANTAHAQNLDTYHGKLLRINTDGSVPNGNPYSSGTEQRKRVWSYGLRNPYTIAFDNRSGRLYANDVGQSSWEEINDAKTGGLNFGWPSAEGSSANPAYVNPVYAYGRGTSNGSGCAITGGCFFAPSRSTYPTTYFGNYFYMDYCGRWIDFLKFSNNGVTRSPFGTGLGGNPVCLMTGPDGNLYYLSRSNGALYKIVYSLSAPPVVAYHPQSDTVALGNHALFTVSVSGTDPLTYEWYKSGTLIPAQQQASLSITNVQAGDTGYYSVRISNPYGSVWSDPAYLHVTPPNTKPQAIISLPAANATYRGGDTISFSGYGTDAEDGILHPSRYRWLVDFHHDTHTHPGPAVSDSTDRGVFVIPTSGETATDVFYRLYLVVTDAQGDTDTAFADITPRLSGITVETQPPGLAITIDGQPCNSPCVIQSVEGMIRTIDAPSPQTKSGITYGFTKWANGGSKRQAFSTPVADTLFTAIFEEYQTSSIQAVADAYVRSGSTANSNYGSSSVLYNRNNSLTKGVCISYLRFDISQMNDPVSVRLRLYGRFDKAGNTSAVDVFDVASQTWSEQTIHYNNRPPEGGLLLASINISGNVASYYEWDLTQHIVNRRLAGASSVSLAIKNRNITSGFLQFNSKENASFRPVLLFIQKGNAPTLITHKHFINPTFRLQD